MKHYNPNTVISMLYLISLIEEEFSGEFKMSIPPSPPHTNMIQYGGTMTPSEYMTAIEQMNHRSNVMTSLIKNERIKH
jgi:hypothetical protein